MKPFLFRDPSKMRRPLSALLFRGLLLGLLLALLAACGGAESAGGGPTVSDPGVYANRVIGTPGIVNSTGATAGQWPFFFQPAVVLGPPGDTFDVLSLGYDPGTPTTLGGTVTVGLGDHNNATDRVCAVDGVGADLAVFENPFAASDGASGKTGTSNEVLTVEVSQNNTGWFLIPWSVDIARGLVERERYTNLAGIVPRAEGGDRFDLADAIAAHGLPADFQACYVRLTDGGTTIADYGNTQSDLYNSGADLDAVGAYHFVTAPGLTP